MENNILVIYVGVHGIRSEDIISFTNTIAEKIIPLTFCGEVIVIPTHSHDTRIECINPIYISDEELIQQNSQLIKDLNSELEYQLQLLKETTKKSEEKLSRNKENNEKENRD